jgi:hypothetical protein
MTFDEGDFPYGTFPYNTDDEKIRVNEIAILVKNQRGCDVYVQEEAG